MCANTQQKLVSERRGKSISSEWGKEGAALDGKVQARRMTDARPPPERSVTPRKTDEARVVRRRSNNQAFRCFAGAQRAPNILTGRLPGPHRS